MRIYIGNSEIAGYYRNLSIGFRNIGVDCDLITESSHVFGYGGESKKPFSLRVWNWANRKRLSKSRFLLSRLVWSAVENLSFVFLILLVIVRYDCFIFSFGSSLLPDNRDLPWLRFFRKIIVSNLMHGSEIRPPYIDGSYQSISGDLPQIEQINKLTKRNKTVAMRHCKYSSFIIGAPFSSSHFLNKKMLNSFYIGVPYQCQSEKHMKENSREESSIKEIRILHSPSHPAAKGTQKITEAILNLREKGYQINFVYLHGVSNQVVLDEIKKCDFVVDQIYSDAPLSGFATEAAWFGKPSVVAGYGFDQLSRFVPDSIWPPSKICHPDKIESSIEELITNVQLRQIIGKTAQSFVHNNWNCEVVARNYVRIFKRDIPKKWWLDPNDVEYFEGACQPVEKTKFVIQLMVETFGEESLCLEDKPLLKKAFIDFAFTK